MTEKSLAPPTSSGRPYPQNLLSAADEIAELLPR